jgi:FKBP-type peptidyl-prolyl cis-trans isomerase
MKRRTAVFGALFGLGGAIVPGLASRALALDDALSIENNAKFLADYKAKNQKGYAVVVRPSGLMFHIIQNGYGKRPEATDSVKVYYTGRLINNVIFDGTSPGLPATFRLNSVIPGWIEAMQLMREGDHWQVVIPPNLGYGVRGSPDGGQAVPPNQVLVFDLKLLATTPAAKRGEKGYVPDPSDKEEQDQ